MKQLVPWTEEAAYKQTEMINMLNHQMSVLAKKD